ncbi:MAG: hypothetical protein JW882_20445 [Deltaproteobacteria bacterium]|nr:hypothetical protein [Deltaproteobacteria bacterium]
MMEGRKGCFGALNIVFPVSGNGLREVADECLQCQDRISCLRTALSTEEGIRMREDKLDHAAKEGLIGRLEMWSRKKELDRLLKQQEKNKKRS